MEVIYLKESMGDRIKRLRLQHNLTQEELGNKVGLKRAAINKYEKGNVENMKRSIIEKMSSVFDVSPSYLMALDENYDSSQKNNQNILTIYNKLEEPRQKKVYNYAEKQLDEQENNVVDLFSKNSYIIAEPESEYYVHRKKHEVKINGLLTAGGGTENFDKFIPIDTEYLERVPNAYDLAFRVKGDSMYPAFENDEVVFVRNTDDYYNGMFAAVEIDGQAYIKKIYIEDNRIRLVSLNDDVDENGDRLYPDFYADEKNDIRLIGKVL